MELKHLKLLVLLILKNEWEFQVLNYYKYCIQLVKQGGIIILDNMLWGGSVINPKEEDAKKIRETGDFIHEDPRVENSLFPIRDGIMVCIKK